MSTPKHTSTSTRLFFGISIPKKVKAFLETAMIKHRKYIKKPVPTDNWHATLLFLGEVEDYGKYLEYLAKPLPQTFTPTATISYIGRGRRHDQLWAYVQPIAPLERLRKDLLGHVSAAGCPVPTQAQHHEFIPHIRLASLQDSALHGSVPDELARNTFTIAKIHLYKSTATPEGSRYTTELTIPLSTL